MFNPDGDDKLTKLTVVRPRIVVSEVKYSPAPPKLTPPQGLTLQTEEEMLYAYLDGSESCRRTYGFSKDGGKIYMVDKERLDNLDPYLKESLRTWVKLKQKEGIWGGVQGCQITSKLEST